MKKLLVLSALSVFVLAGCTPKNEFKAPPPPTVTIEMPEQKTVTVFGTFPGRLVASDEVDIRARVKGFLKTIDFEDGAQVKQGDLLFTIEPEQYQATVNSAEAQLAQAHAALDLAAATLQKNEKAFETKAVSEVDVLTARANKDSAAAGVMSAEAALDNAKLNLSYTKIYAPFTGRVARRSLSVGNLVGSGESTLLTTVVVEAPIDAYFNVDERALLKHSENKDKERPRNHLPPVKLELANGRVFTEDGRVDYNDPVFDPETGTLQVRATFANEQVQLLPGMFAKILLPNEIENALLVPDLAVQQDMAGSFVLTVNAADIVESIYITKGPIVGTQRIVLRDPTKDRHLTINDKIIVNGLQRARPGIPVTAMEAQAPAAAPADK